MSRDIAHFPLRRLLNKVLNECTIADCTRQTPCESCAAAIEVTNSLEKANQLLRSAEHRHVRT